MLLEWFYNHPALRYGGYCIISLILFVPFSFYLSKKAISIKRYNQIAFILIIISISVFEIRNYSRIIKEIKIYNYKPISETFYSIDREYLNMQEKINNLKNNDGIFSKTIF